MIYFTIAKNTCGYLIDSISLDKKLLQNKYPDKTIYESDEPIINIYIVKSELNESHS